MSDDSHLGMVGVARHAEGLQCVVNSDHCCGAHLRLVWRQVERYFFTTVNSTSPEASFTLALPQVVGLPAALKRQP